MLSGAPLVVILFLPKPLCTFVGSLCHVRLAECAVEPLAHLQNRCRGRIPVESTAVGHLTQ